MDFYYKCEEYCQRRRPRTSFQKQYSQRVAFENKVYWIYPTGARNRWMYKAPELPKEIQIGNGIKPTTEELKRIRVIIAAFKPVAGFVSIAGLVYLFGQNIAAQLTWMVKNGQAVLGFDRWGQPTYIELKV